VQDVPVSKTPLSTADKEFRQQLLAQAEAEGNAVVSVAGDESNAPYAFSVGAWRRFGVAEAVVIGLPPEMMPVLINAYVQNAAKGARYEPGKVYEDFFQGVPVTFEKVNKGWYPEYFGSAFLLYGKGGFPALQIIVPTPQGHWPWDSQAPQGFADWQPVLTDSGLPESWEPGVTGP
jgi:hypothetical protein